jgi:hypothetical protein
MKIAVLRRRYLGRFDDVDVVLIELTYSYVEPLVISIKDVLLPDLPHEAASSRSPYGCSCRI